MSCLVAFLVGMFCVWRARAWAGWRSFLRSLSSLKMDHRIIFYTLELITIAFAAHRWLKPTVFHQLLIIIWGALRSHWQAGYFWRKCPERGDRSDGCSLMTAFCAWLPCEGRWWPVHVWDDHWLPNQRSFWRTNWWVTKIRKWSCESFSWGTAKYNQPSRVHT